MTTRRWLGGAGTWTDGTEWSPAGVPGLGDTAVLGAGAAVSVAGATTLAATIVFQDSTASLTIQQTATATPAAGTFALVAVTGGGTLAGSGGASRGFFPSTAFTASGAMLVGSPDPSRPFVFQGIGAPLNIVGVIDVVGAAYLTSSDGSSFTPAIAISATTYLEPGAKLVVAGDQEALGTVHIAGGTLDTTQSAFKAPIRDVIFDGSAGTLVMANGGSPELTNFRAGNLIDIKGVSVSGTLAPNGNGTYAVGMAALTFDGTTTAGATYTATPDGTGGTLVTVSGGAAVRTPAPQYIFGFAFSAATVSFGANGHALLTAPNGTVTDVTGVPTLQFLDGTINERTGTPVDPLFYYARNLDVWAAYLNGGLNAQQHYDQYGWQQGRDPSALFSNIYYLNQNPDVAQAGINPLQHYEQYGWKEGRDPSVLFSTTAYLAHDPDVASVGIDPLVHYIQYGEGENRVAYAATPHPLGPQDPLVVATFVNAERPDVAAAGVDTTTWFRSYGWQGGTAPDALFDVTYYLSHNPDVAAAHIDPVIHYEQYGWREGRNPSAAFNGNAYLAHNPDVAAAGADPLVHYIQYGQAEGRAIYPA